MEQDWNQHDLVRSFGLNRTYAGYKYVICAMLRIREDPSNLELLTKRLYPALAKQFGVTPGGVDQALRTAAKVCCRNAPELFLPWGGEEDSLSVREFLRRLYELDCMAGVRDGDRPR